MSETRVTVTYLCGHTLSLPLYGNSPRHLKAIARRMTCAECAR